MSAKTGDAVNCAAQILLGQTITPALTGTVVDVFYWQYGNTSKQIDVVQDKRGNRSIYFDADCSQAVQA